MVRCIDNKDVERFLTLGKTYEIIEEIIIEGKEDLCKVKVDSGRENLVYKRRFKIINSFNFYELWT